MALKRLSHFYRESRIRLHLAKNASIKVIKHENIAIMENGE